MRVNSRVFTEKSDLLGGIQIPNCPSQFRAEAEQLLMLATKPGFSVTDYANITQLDKLLILAYWREYDGLKEVLFQDTFDTWFLKHATSSDLITRAIRWLVAHNYLLLKPEVLERSMEASSNWRQSVSKK